MSLSSRSMARRIFAIVAAVTTSAVLLSGCAVADMVGRGAERAIDQARDLVRGPDPEADSDTASGSEGDDVGSDDDNTFMDELALGDCVNDEELALSGVGEVYSVDVVPCDEPHDSEIFGFAQYSDGEIPEDEELDRIAEEGCIELFEPYVGSDYSSSSLEVYYYMPTAESWKYGDRDATCELYDMDLDDLVGSMKGSGL